MPISVEDRLKRSKVARTDHDQWFSINQEAYRLYLPNRDTYTTTANGQEKNFQVFDATGVMAMQSFISFMQGDLVPPGRHWVKFEAGSTIDENDRDKFNKEFEDIEDIFFEEIEKSNFDIQIQEVLADLGVGTGAMLIEEGDGIDEPLLKFTAMPMREVSIEVGPGNIPNGFYREYKKSIGVIAQKYGEDALTQQHKDKLRSDPNAELDILDSTLFEPDRKIWTQSVIDKDTKHELFTQEYDYFPAVIPRWAVTPGEKYGRGPAIQTLPFCRVLNKIAELELMSAALSNLGIYTARNDGVINPYTVQLIPGSIIPVTDNSSNNPSLRSLDIGGNPQFLQLKAEELKADVNKAFFADPFGDIEDPVRTATEISARNQRSVRQSGSSFGRMWAELVHPTINVVLKILQRRGAIESDIDFSSGAVALRQVSPLARAQAAEEMQNTMFYFNSLGAVMGPEAALAANNIEEIPGKFAQALGIDKDIPKTKEEIRVLIEQAAQAVQQGAEIEQQ